MSIPLDQLYHYISQCAQESWGDRVIIYRFYPHGSKDLTNLSFLDDQCIQDIVLCPHLFCNDQEPLDFERYEHETFLTEQELNIISQFGRLFKMNLRDYSDNMWDYAVLLHSEQRSKNLTCYENSVFVPAYYWSHAIIARDWFRAAEYLSVIKQPTQKTFLIYNRAWAGTREYRLRFTDLLIESGLDKHCKMNINSIEPELQIHYSDYIFKNTTWKPTRPLENYFLSNLTPSCYSAGFELNDYADTDLEVVLETLFDDDRLHLTEKSLRPIACGQPFILAGTHGSLEYLRSYGFKTYSDIWPETYNHIQDPLERMKEIIALLKQISEWSPETRLQKLQQAQEIAEFNRQHFFSNNFLKLVTSELETNLDRAFLQLAQKNTGQLWSTYLKYARSMSANLPRALLKEISQEDWDKIVAQAVELNLKHTS
jgi:hypothetical protein